MNHEARQEFREELTEVVDKYREDPRLDPADIQDVLSEFVRK